MAGVFAYLTRSLSIKRHRTALAPQSPPASCRRVEPLLKMRLLNCPVFLVLLLTLGSAIALHSPALSATLKNGSPVFGKYLTSHSGRGIRAFTNIPYAEPPVGSLRFADPQPKRPWTTTEGMPDSDQVIMCPQKEVFFHGDEFLGQEDCLYLNVYVPMNPKNTQGTGLPVMFFIHGGGYATGNGGEHLYGPEFLLEEDVILVAGNYRLGPLGFLSTLTEEFPGNWGLKDQTLMLRWIQENIAQFGGDPHRVTIFGESAGAGSVGYHLLSPQSQGLFHGAILQSGNPYENWSNVSRTQTLEFAEKVITALECQGEEVLECMRGKDVEAIIDSVDNVLVWSFHPVVTFSPVKELRSAKKPFVTAEDYMNHKGSAHVPIMVGVTANEGAFIASMVAGEPEERIEEFERRFDEIIPAFTYMFDRFDKEAMKEKVAMMKQRYLGGDEFNWATMQRGLIDLSSDIMFLTGFTHWMDQRFANNAKTFVYKFNYRGSVSFTDIGLRNFPEEIDMGVSHVDDLLHLFPMVKKTIKFRSMSEEDQKMRRQMVKMWTNFATNGDPSTKHQPWTPATQFPIDYMRIGNCNLDVCDVEGKLSTGMERGFFEENLKFVNKLYEYKKIGEMVKEEL